MTLMMENDTPKFYQSVGQLHELEKCRSQAHLQ